VRPFLLLHGLGLGRIRLHHQLDPAARFGFACDGPLFEPDLQCLHDVLSGPGIVHADPFRQKENLELRPTRLTRVDDSSATGSDHPHHHSLPSSRITGDDYAELIDKDGDWSTPSGNFALLKFT